MEAYRDQYATLFNNGKGVTVLAISTDADTTQANWARDSRFPVTFGSDTGQVVGRLYGSTSGRRNARNVFVISPDGKISDRIIRFNELSADAYVELGKMVAKASGKH
jgi:peroxiredoxin